jgi:hypothetical protein
MKVLAHAASLALAALMLTGLAAGTAHAQTRTPVITVATAIVRVTGHQPGYVRLSVRFGQCVRDVRAWVTAGDDGPGNTRSNRVDHAEARPGRDFTVYVSISHADATAFPGTWSVTSVQAATCQDSKPVALDWPNPVFQVTS